MHSSSPGPLNWRPLRALLAASCAVLACSSGWAALGGDAATLMADQTRLNAPFTASKQPLYTAHTATSPDGVRVREYVSNDGLVFAVAWDGPVLPELDTLLGTYFPLYQEAQRQKLRSIQIVRPDVVIESGGRMRAFAGRAYLPLRLPAGVLAQDLP